MQQLHLRPRLGLGEEEASASITCSAHSHIQATRTQGIPMDIPVRATLTLRMVILISSTPRRRVPDMCMGSQAVVLVPVGMLVGDIVATGQVGRAVDIFHTRWARRSVHLSTLHPRLMQHRQA